ncbi:MAG: beta-galactosidase, partial [Planctomycetes bacterium]|nr:beta-galactosidase [Planctomycetota bacterium]
MQYFRVRDPLGDPERTHEMWRATLDRMAAAGMNHVTTYVPWDWHEEEQGKFRWDGDRDLDKFLSLAYARGFLVGLKPGPFITAEWPRGFGSCGAVPAWFRAKHPGSLVLNRRARPWSFDPLGRSDQTQPRYDAPEFMEATRAWFKAIAPIVRRYVFERP